MGKLFSLFQNAYFLVLQEEMDWTQISSLSLLALPVTKKYICLYSLEKECYIKQTMADTSILFLIVLTA